MKPVATSTTSPTVFPVNGIGARSTWLLPSPPNASRTCPSMPSRSVVETFSNSSRETLLPPKVAVNEISNWPATLSLPKTLVECATFTVTPAPPRSAPPKMPPTFTPESTVTETG